MGLSIRLTQIDLSHLGIEKIDIHHTVCCCGSKSDRITAQCFSDTKDLTAIGYLAFGLDFTHMIIGAIFDGWQRLGIVPLTGLVSLCRHLKVKCFMGSLRIVQPGKPKPI